MEIVIKIKQRLNKTKNKVDRKISLKQPNKFDMYYIIIINLYNIFNDHGGKQL